MREETISVRVSKQDLNTVEDCMSLLEWAQSQDGIGVSVFSTVDGHIYVQAEGVNVPTVRAQLGSSLLWDGTVFSVVEGGAK